ncbi:heme A synthase [Lysinibacillus sp. 2017]|uniref:COX15/CtaA family protein n=1 Tax=unclassified Lysinibacillus TaxID=2636778 RepID=UPI000D529F61|nr:MULTISPECIES: heme A synthase [unclassified Lysinibacillus]AWE06546.1 heme A synthase [Lysinibacillus sp. 2017]TGN35417.1 heme A synthase [Lysinibacillus sp. S2017]
MQQKYYKYLKWFAVAATLGMLLILQGGALVTKTDSGLGCGRNWPDCNGSLIPKEITSEVLIEFSHRLITGAVSIFILVLVVWTWRALGHIREVKFLGFMALFFLILQALIGAAQVLWGQGDFILALHFGISLISFAAVLLLTFIVFEVDQKFDADKIYMSKKLKIHTISVTLYSYVVVYTGALVRHTDASLVCPDWPFCRNNQPFALPFNMYEWVQMGHRFAVLLFVLWIAYITIYVIKNYKKQRVIYWGWIIASIIVVMQVLAGMLVVLLKLYLLVSLLHSLLITLLFGLLCYMILLVSRSK